ncbi:MAG: 2-C-methyl-D-erythritol 2,4-cyclodiphosphate synthase [Planctomycetes bacterium]|nr:2-C-methyl-D-erythritol 2,4-cyclodiphosphate synthase [Planctomycetota bacterium]
MPGLENLAVGLGMDCHRFESGRPLVLGGVEVPHDVGLKAHSDGDVLLHAVIDAVLSAADLPDLGSLYPDDDPAHAGRSSLEMAREVARKLKVGGTRILSLDSVLICQKPKIAPHREAIRASIAEAFGLRPGQVNVKGKTYEGMGPLGRKEGIEARAVALVLRGG